MYGFNPTGWEIVAIFLIVGAVLGPPLYVPVLVGLVSGIVGGRRWTFWGGLLGLFVGVVTLSCWAGTEMFLGSRDWDLGIGAHGGSWRTLSAVVFWTVLGGVGAARLAWWWSTSYCRE